MRSRRVKNMVWPTSDFRRGDTETRNAICFAASLVVAAFLAASCGVFSDDKQAAVRVEQADGPVPTLTGGPDGPDNDSGQNSDSEPDSGGRQNPQSEGSAEGGTGANIDGPIRSSLGPDMYVQRYTLPPVPNVVLPDVSVLSETGSIVEVALGDFAGEGTGLDVVGVDCSADGGEIIYAGSDEAGSFFDLETDGSGSYVRSGRDGGNVYVDIAADGSGSYEHYPGDGSIEIVVDADGSGSYYDGVGEGYIKIGVESDGSWSYVRSGRDGGNLYVDIAADGSGSYEHYPGDGSIKIVVDADGSGSYYNGVGDGYVETDFTTTGGLLDPELVVGSPKPIFSIVDRFPPLAKLGSLRPPCATVIRLDANVLFDFDSDELRPEAVPVVERVASVLMENDKSLEVHGHTDSKGDDSYNQDLSERRAETFASALIARGVQTEVVTFGYGEARPAAPNEKSDGTDNPAGRQLNRRIEVVIPE